MQAIVNVTPQWGIGKDNNLVVRIRTDMRRFRLLTTGNTIIVGRRTLESFPNGEPLPNRTNIVLTRDPAFKAKNVISCSDLIALGKAIKGLDPDSVFVCGGEQTYQLLLPYCNKALVTLNDSDIKADRFFPNLNLLPNWILTEVGEKQYENQTAFRFLTYTNTDPLEL